MQLGFTITTMIVFVLVLQPKAQGHQVAETFANKFRKTHSGVVTS
jgi:hypothetical protein